MSKKWSRVINAGQVRREFIDIYYRPRHGHRARQARSERVACVKNREGKREKQVTHGTSPSARTCVQRVRFYTRLYRCTVFMAKNDRQCVVARESLPSIHSYAFNRVFVDIFYVNLVCIVQRDLVLYSGCCHNDPDRYKFEGESCTIICWYLSYWFIKLFIIWFRISELSK